MSMTIKKYQNRDEQSLALAESVASSLSATIDVKGRATLSVPGGSTPKAFFAALSQKPLPWGDVSVLPNDERFVPEGHERSNASMIKETLFINKASAASYVSLYAKGETPEEAIPVLESALEKVLPLDILILGMGEDMHTASLFPGADKIAEALSKDAPTLLPMRAAGAGEPRITLSAPVLCAAKEVHLLITGEAKLVALEKAMQAGSAEEAPIRAILDNADVTVHFAP